MFGYSRLLYVALVFFLLPVKIGFAADEGAELFAKENSPKEELRKKLFEASLDALQCQTANYNKRDGVQFVGKNALNVGEKDEGLDQAIKDILFFYNGRDVVGMQSYFHERLKVTKAAIRDVFSDIDRLYKTPYEVSVYKLWMLNNPKRLADGALCENGEYRVFSLYGYPLQVGIWLQVMGRKELGRTFILLVPIPQNSPDKKLKGPIGKDGIAWRIGALNTQQWTHAEKDYVAWTQEGIKEQKASMMPAAYITYDLAAKLSDGGPYLQVVARDEIIKARDQVFSKDAFENEVRKVLKDYRVLYTASMLSVNGAGILVRIEVPGELSSNDVHKTCQKMGLEFTKQKWFQNLKGLKCSYVIKGEDPSKEGVLGGVHLTKEEFKIKNK